MSDSGDGWRVAMSRFDQWLALAPEQREAELERLRQIEPQVHQRLVTLIHADADAEYERFLNGSAVEDALAEGELAADRNLDRGGRRLGPWELERVLGAGGMGQVWLAHRHDGLYAGVVAIKMLRDATASAADDERFAREGELLARLAHPNIARLLDAGLTHEGERYLVLEYVAGERIDHYCDQHRLNVAARIRLFLQVCAAVSHAHANLIVHRDLKPSNILV